MDRRQAIKEFMGAAAVGAFSRIAAAAGLPKDKIKRIRYYRAPDENGHFDPYPPTFALSTNIVLVETESGLVGIGEGGTSDTIEQCAGLLIGQDPFRTDNLWQTMFRGHFYPAGREMSHAIGALDVALWDLKGKALAVPLYQLLGGQSRNYVECYANGFPMPTKGTIAEAAQACIAAGLSAFRVAPSMIDHLKNYEGIDKVNKIFELCREVREAVGKDGAWAIDFHTEFSLSDAVTLANLIEPLRPRFAEDMVRTEEPSVYRTLRPQVKVPIAVGEQFGSIWDCNELIENNLIDYIRATIPNLGGVTEYMKLISMCETHYVGLLPHFPGPVSEAVLVHCLTATSVPALMELVGGGRIAWSYLNESYDFRKGKMWPNERPGIGVDVDLKKLQFIAEYTEYHGPAAPLRMTNRPDGSYTNW